MFSYHKQFGHDTAAAVLIIMVSIKDKPHVQSVEEEDAVAWFQSTLLGRTICEGERGDRQSHIDQRVRK